MEFRDVVRKRRMVRSFSDEPVAEDVLARVLDTARRGPSAGYSQGIEFVVVTDADVRATIARGSDGARPLPAIIPPVYILICAGAEIYRSRYREDDKATVRARLSDDELWAVPYWHVDAGAAMMLLLLAAVDEGLGAWFVGAYDQEWLRELLDIPESFTAVGITMIGHPAPAADRPSGSAKTRTRRPIDDVVHRERW